MKITIKDLRDRMSSINKVLAYDKNIKLSYWMGKMAKKIQEELKALEDTRMKLIRKLGEEQPDGNLKVPEKNNDAFEAEFNPLLDEEIELDIKPVRVLLLKGIRLSSYDIGNLEGFIEEASEAEIEELQKAIEPEPKPVEEAKKDPKKK